MNRIQFKLSLLLGVAVLLSLIFKPEPAQAQWPPFKFSLVPTVEGKRVTIHINLFDRVDWALTNVTIKIPLPDGARFVEVKAIPSIEADFDGKEITFFTDRLSRRIWVGDAYFVVEVPDQTQTALTIQPWISWEGEQPGDYLVEPVTIDLTHDSLDWNPPSPSRLQLDATAVISNEIITYYIYPKNVGGRMWDVKINVPIPAETTFLSAEPHPIFVSNFDGRELSFTALELAQGVDNEPLSFKVSVDEAQVPFITTYGWATWKNTSRHVGRSVVVQEETRTGDLLIQPQTSQVMVVDAIGDVPFSDYDLTGITLQDVILPDDEPALKTVFYTFGDLPPLGQLYEYILYIDSDCSIDTGTRQNLVGAEYRIRYRRKDGRAVLYRWNGEVQNWDKIKKVITNYPVDDSVIKIWTPYELIDNNRQFCWEVEALNRSQASNSKLIKEVMPNSNDIRLIRYVSNGATVENETELFSNVQVTGGTFIDVGAISKYWPGWSEPAADWTKTDFDDSDWLTGPTGIGYGNGDFATDLNLVTPPQKSESTPKLVQRVDEASGMVLAELASGQDANSVYLRQEFTVDDPALLTDLTLEVEYKGSFVVYLNGAEISRRGLDVSDETLTSGDRTGPLKAVIDLTEQIDDLVPGTNVLAFQAHQTENSSNLFIAPSLTWESDPAALAAVNDTQVADTSLPPPVSLSVADLGGKLAVPLDNGQVAYDVYIFSVPDGRELARIPNARQPNFRSDGQRMLINHEGGGVENVYEYNFNDNTEQQVSDAPQDWHPFYDPWGNRVVYGNDELTVGGIAVPKRDKSGEVIIDENTGKPRYTGSVRPPFIFVQCGLLPPHQETEPRCRDIPNLGVLVPAGQVGEIQGTHPVWTSNDMIAYKGCNTWAGSGLCGIYIVPSSSTKGFSNGFIPRQLTRDTTDVPADTKGNLIAFTSRRDGDWEAYIMNLDGTEVRNLSNSPTSNDGLPAISPDGNWVAFVSDRDGQWAVWVASITGEITHKLFELPTNTPWGDGPRTWTNERLSWAP